MKYTKTETRLESSAGPHPVAVATRLMICCALIAMLTAGVCARAQQSDSEEEGQFRFRFVGPRVGNRIAAVAGLPGDSSTYYAGAASGGAGLVA